MRAMPFAFDEFSFTRSAMGVDYHLIPQMHVLFFGPIECARHSFSSLVDDEDASILVVTDVQASLGETERLVADAVSEIVEGDDSIRGFLLCTACQTTFLGIDFDGLCADLHERFGLFFAHLEANRMRAENIPGASRKDIPGGDRYHFRKALFKMLGQREGPAGKRGVLVLSEDPLAGECDLKQLQGVEGIDWVRSVGDLQSFDELLACKDALFVVSTSIVWNETAEFLSSQYGIESLVCPTSYDFDEIDAYYTQLAQAVERKLGSTAAAVVEDIRMSARERAGEAVNRVLALDSALDLDVRLVHRPFSMVEALGTLGFEIVDFMPSRMRMMHKEPDDLPAYERLAAKDPQFAVRYASNSRGKRVRRSNRARNIGAPGRFVPSDPVSREKHVRGEQSWWGYSSIVELMRELEGAMGEGERR